MKFYVISIFVTLLLVLSPPKVYNFRLKNMDGQTVSYKSLKGEKITVIDFWATWCKPCVKAIPKLVEMNDELQSKGVQFIGISIDGPRNLNKVKPFAKSLGIDYPVLLDTDSQVMARLGVRLVPTLLIVNSDDEIIHFHEGYTTGEEKIIRKEILKELEP